MIITVTFDVDDNSTLEVLTEKFELVDLKPQMLAMNADIFQEFFEAMAQLKMIADSLGWSNELTGEDDETIDD